jgi:type I restriction enzyme S subunit
VIPLIDVDLNFLAYVLEYADLNRLAIRTAQPLINSSIVRDLPAVLPTRTDQEAIARFLDHIDLRIQRSIAAQERLIALLREEEQAIVYRAAVRGLDSSVPFKFSGVDWLGDVPAHWKVVPLRRITKSRCDGPFGSGLTSAHYVDQGIRVVRLQNISPGGFADGEPAFISEEHYATLGNHDVVAGDLLVAGLGDDKRHVGRACVAPKGIEPAMVKADCFRFRLRAEQPEFVARQLSATARLTVGFARGSTRQRMNLGAMGARPVALPPLHEQLAVTRYLDDVEDRIGRATNAVERQIVSVREYRTRLIADVVTGKLDVREAAGNLPEKPEAGDPAFNERLEEVAAT